MAVDITLVPLQGPTPPRDTARLLCTLSGRQQLRARAMVREDDRRCYILCHVGVLQVATQAFGGQHVTCEVTASGRPLLSNGHHLSISRAGGHSAIALCPDHEIGIDLESVNAAIDWMKAAAAPGLTARLRSRGMDTKRAFLRAWTELEAIAKHRQIPLQRLLSHPGGQHCSLRSLYGRDMVLTLASERPCPLTLRLADWDDDGNLHTTERQTWQVDTATASGTGFTLIG